MRRNNIISNPAMQLSTKPKRSPRQLWISHPKESFCPWMNMFQNSSFVTLYSKQIWSKNRPRAVSYFPFGSQQIESMRPKSFSQTFSHRSKRMPENKRPAKQTKNKKDVLAPNFGKFPGAIGKQTNKTAKQTNTYLRLICCTCTKRAFLTSDSIFFRCFRIWVWICLSYGAFPPKSHLFIYKNTKRWFKTDT